MIRLDRTQKSTVTNALQNFYADEFEKLRHNNSLTLANAQEFKFTNTIDRVDDLSFPINNTYDVEDFIKTRLVYNNDYNRSNAEQFIESINSVSFGPMKLEEALPIIIDESTNANFYGILMVDKDDNKINLLHPMIALFINQNWDFYKDREYTYYIYQSVEIHPLNTGDEIDFYKNRIETLLSIQSFELQNKSTTLHTVSEGTIDTSIVQDVTSTHRLRNLTYNTEGSVVYGNENVLQSAESTYTFVPHQILNDGLAYPYYGFSAVKKRGHSLNGYNLSPMLSANIGSNVSTNENDLTATNVCTGRTKATTVEGPKTLNHSNLRSPLNRDILLDGWQYLVQASIETSVELLKEFTTPAKTELTRDDFKTTEAYLLYVKLIGEQNGN